MLIGDSYNDRIRKIDAAGFVSTIAGMNTAGDDRSSATSALLYQPTDVVVQSGAVYFADSGNHRIRRLWWNGIIETAAKADMTQGSVLDMWRTAPLCLQTTDSASMVPGRTVAIQALGGNTIDSLVRYVGGIARGPDGEVYISDTNGHRILRFAADGTASVVAGNGSPGFAGDGGPAYLAQVNTPTALSLAPDGRLFIAEFGRVRAIQPDGRITTILNEHATGSQRTGRQSVSFDGPFYFHADGRASDDTDRRERQRTSGWNNGGLALSTRLNDVRGIAVSSTDETGLRMRGTTSSVV